MNDLERLAAALEHATDLYVEACNEAARSEGAYQLVFHRALVGLDGAETTKIKRAEGVAVNERVRWLSSVAVEKGARAKVEQLRGQLIAAQTVTKHYGSQDGGGL